MIIIIITIQRMDYSILRNLSFLLHQQIYEGVELSEMHVYGMVFELQARNVPLFPHF